jgi:hypothetical protein
MHCEPVKKADRRVDLRARCLSNALSPAIAGSKNYLISTWGSRPSSMLPPASRVATVPTNFKSLCVNQYRPLLLFCGAPLHTTGTVVGTDPLPRAPQLGRPFKRSNYLSNTARASMNILRVEIVLGRWRDLA